MKFVEMQENVLSVKEALNSKNPLLVDRKKIRQILIECNSEIEHAISITKEKDEIESALNLQVDKTNKQFGILKDAFEANGNFFKQVEKINESANTLSDYTKELFTLSNKYEKLGNEGEKIEAKRKNGLKNDVKKLMERYSEIFDEDLTEVKSIEPEKKSGGRKLLSMI